MPQITDIKPQKKLRHGEPRFNIYLDGKYAFALPAEVLTKAGLKIDQTLNQGEIDKLVKENEFAKFFDLILRFISFRPRSEKEIKDWFKKKEVGEETQKMIWEKLKHLGHINDEEFARWWIEQRTTFRPQGQRAITTELRQKGISPSIINKLQVPSSNEKELAQRAIEKKLKIYRNLPPMELRKKLTSFLARRGFSWEIIEEVIDEIFKKE